MTLWRVENPEQREDQMRHDGLVESASQFGPAQRFDAAPTLTIKSTGGASMAEPNPTTIIVYTDKHKIPFLIDADDYEAVRRYVWHIYEGYPRAHAGRGVTKRPIYLHVFLLRSAPAGFVWDHINRDTRDNRRANLRCVTSQGNMRNMRVGRRNKSGVLGVSWNVEQQRWRANIKIGDGKVKYLGSFQTVSEAATARLEGERRYWR